ncbi:MAG TPA: type I DNA topoisomerase [Vampirovibrionales bacterium]
MKNLVIVESPAKASTIEKYLGKDYRVLASYGHIRDLPSKNGSVNPDESFAMKWELDPKAKKRVDEIAKEAKKAENLLLATDPDREGEAISWHVHEVLKEKKVLKDKTVKRVVFNQITKNAVLEAISNPREVNGSLVDAYIARRALDYLVGFTLSPVLWRKLPGSRSAGRVQSVALRLICDRELEIEAFNSQEYWSVNALLEGNAKISFSSHLVALNGEKLDKLSLGNEEEAKLAEAAVKQGNLSITKVDKKQVKRNPQPPFTTSTLQQEASRKLGFSATRTMQLAQRLYEGIDVKGERIGLITYMRTDSTHLAKEAIEEFRDFIKKEYGDKYLPESVRVFKSKAKNAQEAHEAIRPVQIEHTPAYLKSFLEEDQFKLYDLIWKRALSCQMEHAILDQASIDISSDLVTLRASGSVMVFDGFTKLYSESKDDKADDDGDKRLPNLEVGESINCLEVKPEQHFTKPAPRFTEASLIKKLEELGIGRPSTYASIIRILIDRNYARMESKRFIPEDRGRLVTSFLCSFFEKYVQFDFTAALEEKLDEIASNRLTSQKVLTEFWKDFHKAIDDTKELTITDVLNKLDEVLGHHFFPEPEDGTDPKKCKVCDDGRLGLKLGKFGAFIGCSNYPTCKFTRQLKSGSDVDDALYSSPVELGQEPETKKTVFMCKGPYGFYVQLGEEEEIEVEVKSRKKSEGPKTKIKKIKPKRASLPAGTNPSELKLSDALDLLSLPREVGIFPETGEKIVANNGRFGPYIQIGSMFISLKPEDNVLTIDQARALELYELSGKKKILLGEYKTKPVEVQKGRFGYFIVYKREKYAVPKSKKAEELTLEEASELIEKKLESSKKTKKTASKKAATKKTTAKAKTTKKKTVTKKASTTKAE